MKNTLLAFALTACYFFSLAQPKRYDVVINEIMSNPSPAAGLPNVKYVELKNVSSYPIDLRGWNISDGSSVAIIRADFVLLPDSFVIISSTTNASALSLYGNVLAVSNFPTLRVNGDIVILRNESNATMHVVQYEPSWHQNAVKNNGGWSLEMIDATNPCSGNSNWTSSNHSSGGTPGMQNSVKSINKDEDAPRLLHAYAQDSKNITLVFNETLDSSSASTLSYYSLASITTSIQYAVPLPPLFNKVTLTLNAVLEKNKIYPVSVQSLMDCSGNKIMEQDVQAGLPDTTGALDIIINEILFNPPERGVDYLELYNRSKRIINAKDLWITNRNNTGDLTTLRRVCEEDYLIFPGDFIVLTESSKIVRQQFITLNPDAFLDIATMPSLPNQNGSIVLLNSQGNVIDELKYDENWHFPLVTNYKGIALERIDPEQATAEKTNWFSAASSVGYGTPGYRNSQFRKDLQLQGTITLSPTTFSPDNDGFDDFLSINYHFAEQGNVCNITAFDAAGKMVKQVVSNGICGVEGFFRWDGLDKNNQRLPIGIYIIITEVYNLQGKTKRFKNAVTLARRIN